MLQVIQFALLGLGVGAIYAMTAQGLVLIYRSSKVLNFAQGAFALVGAYTYYELTLHGWPTLVAAVCAVAVSAVVGYLTQSLIMRPLRASSTLTRLVATIGVLTVIQSIAALIWGDNTAFVKSLLPQSPWTLSPTVTIGIDKFLLLGVGFLVSGALWIIYRNTLFGLATSAVAENPRIAESLGQSAQRVASINWAVGGALAGLAGVLIAPINGLSVTGMTQLVFGSLAAALLGAFRSFPLTLAGGLLIGIAQSETVRFSSSAGWSTAVPFLILIVFVLVRGTGTNSRTKVSEKLAEVGTGRIRPWLVGLGIATLAASVLGLNGNWTDVLVTSLIAGIVGLSYVIVVGYSGQLSLAQYSIAGLGSLVAARAAADHHLPFLLAVVVGATAAGLLGAVFGLIARRTNGEAFAVVTLGIALSLNALILENPSFTGGFTGITVPSPSVFGLSVDPIAYPQRFAGVCAAFFAAAALITVNLRRGSVGRRLISVRGNDRAAATLGINPGGARIYAFIVASSLAGLAGGLSAFRQPNLSLDGFDLTSSINMLVAVVLMGAGFFGASVNAGLTATGGVIYYMLSLTGYQQYLPLALGLLLLINLVTAPGGLMVMNIANARKLAGRFKINRENRPRREPSEPAGEADAGPVQVRARSLSAEGLGVRFGGVVALDDVSLWVRPGRVVGLIGPNGAGKTTFIDLVTGLTRSSSGSILYDGKAIQGWSAHRRARSGIGRSLQSLELFDELSVRENLLCACETRSRWRYVQDLISPGHPRLSSAALAAARHFGLQPDLDRRPTELPYGRRRLVAIARAVAAQPSVLLLDEPAAGLSAGERVELGRLVRDLAMTMNTAVLIVEHDVQLVTSICDEITVLDFGHVIAQGSPEVVTRDPSVIAAFLGGRSDRPDTSEDAASEPTISTAGGVS